MISIFLLKNSASLCFCGMQIGLFWAAQILILKWCSADSPEKLKNIKLVGSCKSLLLQILNKNIIYVIQISILCFCAFL